MNRILNHPDRMVEDMLIGFLAAHGDRVAATANPRVIKSIYAGAPGRVGIVSGGGSGHEPAFLGYLGRHLLDAVAVGEVFSSPSAKSFADAFAAADGGEGVVCLYGNYAGDNMNVKMAMRLAEQAGVRVEAVVANDDVPSAPAQESERRRGVAGEILMWKAAAACAAAGGSLEQVADAARQAIAHTRSMGIGLSACTIPAAGKANFHIADGQMEVGIGHHGEPGVQVLPTASARQMAELMLEILLADLPLQRGDQVALLLSGMGATPLMEQYILYGELFSQLQARGIQVNRPLVGNYFTALEMMGASVTLMKLTPELAAGLDHPCQSPALTVGALPC